jgi:hypothetical protein
MKQKFIQLHNGSISIQCCYPKIDGEIQPMELLLVIDNEEDECTVFNFRKEQAQELFEEMKQAMERVEVFG